MASYVIVLVAHILLSPVGSELEEQKWGRLTVTDQS